MRLFSHFRLPHISCTFVTSWISLQPLDCLLPGRETCGSEVGGLQVPGKITRPFHGIQMGAALHVVSHVLLRFPSGESIEGEPERTSGCSKEIARGRFRLLAGTLGKLHKWKQLQWTPELKESDGDEHGLEVKSLLNELLEGKSRIRTGSKYPVNIHENSRRMYSCGCWW